VNVNAARFVPGQRDGHYESFYQRANHPTRPLAFWIRYTMVRPARRPEAAIGELWAMFFNGEDAVTDNLSPYIDAAPTEEQKYFLATQQVDEARHTVFFARFFREVLGVEGSIADGLAACQPELNWGYRTTFGHDALNRPVSQTDALGHTATVDAAKRNSRRFGRDRRKTNRHLSNQIARRLERYRPHVAQVVRSKQKSAHSFARGRPSSFSLDHARRV